MKGMRLAEVNAIMANRSHQGTCHNAGMNVDKHMSKKQMMMKDIGHELKVNPPRVLAKTRKKFGKARAEKQRKAILLNKARQRGLNIPKK